jgi:hypothetical protein
MEHLMLDIETLDTQSSAVVLSVGWVCFDEFNLGDAHEMALDIDEQLDMARTISGDTLKWWMGQSEMAREQAFDPSTVYSINDLEDRLTTIIQTCGIKHVWSHGPAFDIATLKSLMRAEPWDFRSLRDTRTLAMLAPNIARVKPVTAHSAADDAVAQAKWVQAMLTSIKGLEFGQ